MALALFTLLCAVEAAADLLHPHHHHNGAQRHLCVPFDGDDANADDALGRSNSFLPDPSMFRSSKRAGDDGRLQSRDSDRPRDSDRLQSRFRSLSQSCSRPFLPVGGSNAMGSHLNALVYPLAFGLATNRTAMTPPLGAYATAGCDTLACFFKPLATCGLDAYGPLGENGMDCREKWTREAKPSCDYSALQPREVVVDEAWSLTRTRGCCGMPHLRAARLKKGAFSFGARGVAALPPEYAHRGQFWFVGQILHWLMRPNERTSKHVQRVAEHSGLSTAPRPMVGLHVRHGDSCKSAQETNKKRRCSSFDEYWYHALAMRARYGVKSVFVATDDAAVVAAARNASRAAGLPVYFASSAQDLNWDAVLLDKSFDAESTALDVITDLLLLARCDAFVGKFTSNLDRIAYALLAARSKCLKPLVSLDSLWCHDWSNKVGKSLFGEFLC